MKIKFRLLFWNKTIILWFSLLNLTEACNIQKSVSFKSNNGYFKRKTVTTYGIKAQHAVVKWENSVRRKANRYSSGIYIKSINDPRIS